MNKNDIFEIEITGITDEGDGVGRAEGMAVFVPYALMGEVVRVIIIKVLKNYAAGKLLEVIKPSENRLKSECEYFYKCGGCRFWPLPHPAGPPPYPAENAPSGTGSSVPQPLPWHPG